MRRLADPVGEAEDVAVAVTVGREDRVLRMLDGDHRRLRVEHDRVRQHERPVRTLELDDRLVDAVREDHAARREPVPDQVELRAALGALRFESSVATRRPFEFSIQTASRSRVRSRNWTCAFFFSGMPLAGEKTGRPACPRSATCSSFAPSVTTNATAVAASRARTTAVDRTRATPGDSTQRRERPGGAVGTASPASHRAPRRPARRRSR